MPYSFETIACVTLDPHSTLMDPDTMMPRYAVDAIALDAETGEAIADDPLAPRQEFTDPDQWRAAADALRQTLLTS